MREIIFRGKTDNGEWVEGYLTRRPSAIQYGVHYSPWFIDTSPRDPDDSGDFYNVDGETVGQYTGLTDKNGKKIFEGDIVKGYLGYGDNENNIAYIEYQEDSIGFVLVEILKEDSGKYFEISDDVKVIGNIHDNPELLGENKDESIRFYI